MQSGHIMQIAPWRNDSKIVISIILFFILDDFTSLTKRQINRAVLMLYVFSVIIIIIIACLEYLI